MKSSIALQLMFLLLASGALAQPTYAADINSQIEEANRQFYKSAAKGDSRAMAALYSAQGQVMAAGSDPLVGPEAIEKFWRGALQSGIAGVKLTTVDIFGSGAQVSEVGRYELLDKTGKMLDRGKYIVIWQHEHGHWKLLRDMFSTNVPPTRG